MRIQELIKTQYTSTPISDKEIQDLEDTPLDKPERGAYAVGNPTYDPHVFHKQTISATDLKNDPTFQYIKAIQPYIDSNPYFPKTYTVDIKLDRNGQPHPQYHVESLVHGTDYSKQAETPTQGEGYTGDSFYWMANRMYGNENWIKAAPMTAIMSMHKKPLKVPQYVWAKLAALYRLLYKEYPNMSTATKYNLELDPKLVQAIKLIKKLENSNPLFTDDQHANNLMIRRTSIGPQLVINDPLATKSSSELSNTNNSYTT